MDKSDFSDEPYPRLACLLLIDTSGCMEGERIEKLNANLRAFRENLMGDDLARKRIELSIVTFDREVKVLHDFGPLENFQPCLLTAQHDERFMGTAICQALDNIEACKDKYINNGIQYHRPSLFLLTGGQPEGEPYEVVEKAKERLRAVQDGKHVNVFPFAVGEGVDLAELSDLAGTEALHLKDLDFKKQFSWLSASLVKTSHSEGFDKVFLPPPDWRVVGAEVGELDAGSVEIEPTIKEVEVGGKVTGIKIGSISGDIVGGDKIGAIPEEQVQFTSYYPTEVKPQRWYTLLAYMHVKSAQNAVHEDSQIRLGQRPKDYGQGHGKATQTIARGTEIIIEPELPGCRFNPPKARVLWLEDWHRIEFRMQASEGVPGFALNSAVNGRLSFYVGPILVADIKLWAHFPDDVDSIDVERPETAHTSDPYQAVFVSYSHSDTQIVRELEKAYVALGMKYLRDVWVLRSGEKWNPALLTKIDEADIFQLCWSTTAKTSIYVEQEWRHALRLKRESFIRPVYWETPMPEPPGELADIHFAFLNTMTIDAKETMDAKDSV